MSKVYITGDLHGAMDINKLASENFPEGNNLTKEDYVIICGDFGLVWSEPQSKAEWWWLKWLNDKPWTTLFVDGNHENHVQLNSYPITEWHGGKVHMIMPSVIHLMRGQIYDINGYKWFTYGGAESVDKAYRTPYKTWWPQETPSLEEYDEAVLNLYKVDFNVDYIITHAAPQDILEELFYSPHTKIDGTPYHLHDFYQGCEYKDWYCGHYHINCDIKPNFHMLYTKIVEINCKGVD